MIPADLDDEILFRITLARLICALLLWMLLITAGCALIFRWTNATVEEQPYSTPLRTRPPTS